MYEIDTIESFNKISANNFNELALVVYNFILSRKAYISGNNIIVREDDGNLIEYAINIYTTDKVFMSKNKLLSILNTDELLKLAILKFNNRNNRYYDIYRFSVNNGRLPNELESSKYYKYIKERVSSYNGGTLKKCYIVELNKMPNWKWSYIELSKEYISYNTLINSILSFTCQYKKNYRELCNLIKKYDDHMLEDIYREMVNKLLDRYPFFDKFKNFTNHTFPRAIALTDYAFNKPHDSNLVIKIFKIYAKTLKKGKHDRFHPYLYYLCKLLYNQSAELKVYVDNLIK
jgi:hypothetical protein